MKQKTKGKYRGECRLNYNILEQWDGKRWKRVVSVQHKPSPFCGRMIFDVEDMWADDSD